MWTVVYSTLFNLALVAINTVVPKVSSASDSEDTTGCSYRGNYYESGMKIKSQDPCVYCVCENSTLQCTLELCSTYSSIPKDCKIVSKPGKCCQELACNKTLSKETPPRAQLNQGCTVGQKHFKDGEAIPSSDPCQQCYCIQNQAQCITQECLLPPDVVLNCQPVIEKDKCCPVRYHCQKSNGSQQTIEVPSEDFIATSKKPTGSLTTQTPVTSSNIPISSRKQTDEKQNNFFNQSGCQENGHWYKIGEKVQRGNDPCMNCICQKDGVICTIVQCRSLPLGVSNCKQARDNQCCPTANNCTCTYNMDEPYARSYEPTTCDSCSYNNTVYPLGARIHTKERCQVCLCRDSGIYCLGRTECDDPPDQLSAYKSCKPFYNDDLDSCCPMAYDCIDGKNHVKRILINGKENPDYEETNVTSSGRNRGDETDIPTISADSSSTKAPIGCELEGKAYKVGERIEVADPCLRCKCNTHNVITCSRSACQALPFGVSECAPVTGQCCPDRNNCTCNYQKPEFHGIPLKDMKCARCISNERQYNITQKMEIDDPCFICTCSETGIFCKKSKPCENEMSIAEMRSRECTPVFGDDKCCPADYNCKKSQVIQGRVLNGPASPPRGNRKRLRPKGCVHEGKLFQINTELPKPDPCTTCTCEANGTIACVSMQCQRQPVGVNNCKRIRDSNVCCPVIVDCSCFHLEDSPEGRTYTDVTCGTCLVRSRRYRPGDIVPSHDPCRQCECTERGVVCETVIECDPPPSDDCTPTYNRRQCCPIQYDCRRTAEKGQSAATSLHMQNAHASFSDPTEQALPYPHAPQWPPMTSVPRNPVNRDSPKKPMTGKISDQPGNSRSAVPGAPDYYDYYDDEVTTPPPKPLKQKFVNKGTPAGPPSFRNPCIIGASRFEHDDEISMIDPCVRCRCSNSNIQCRNIADCTNGYQPNNYNI